MNFTGDLLDNQLLKLLEKFPDNPWSYLCLSENPNITWGIVQANPDKQWDYEWLSAKNPNITWGIVQANPDKPWSYYWLSENPNITWDIVQANPDKPWDCVMLSRNKFNKDPVVQARIDKRIKKRELLYSLLLPYYNKYISYEIVMLS